MKLGMFTRWNDPTFDLLCADENVQLGNFRLGRCICRVILRNRFFLLYSYNVGF